jgi:hypothetical protein
MAEQVQSRVCRSLGGCMPSAHGWTVVWWVVVCQISLQRDGVGSRATCHELVCDTCGFSLCTKWVNNFVFICHLLA